MALEGQKAERKKATRPYLIKALIGLVVAIAGAVVANLWAIEKGGEFDSTDQIGLVGVLVFVIGGVILVRSAVSAFNIAASDSIQERAKGTPVSFLVYAAGYLFVALGAISLTPVKPASLLFGGALTGVILGIAAQQTIGNFFAGFVLVVVRPFSVGDLIYLKGTLGEYEGTVTEMTLFYVHIATDRGPVMLPNAGVLASAVGPGARAEKQKEREEEQASDESAAEAKPPE
jgi:small-conductance mechanosensitive channel